tara:strand:- start:65 stop:790 length:726 start_codon:yes stop_codon:yes gene_type:complete
MKANYPFDHYYTHHIGNPGDAQFYLKACLNSNAVLELGSGIGRIQTVLQQAGIHTVGIELNAQAIAIASGWGVKTISADMRNFSLSQRFDRVIIPYNSLYCLTNIDEQIKCLRCVSAHMRSKGTLIFDVYAGDAFSTEVTVSRTDPVEIVTQITINNELWDVYECSELDAVSQKITVTYTYLSQLTGETKRGVIHHRYLCSHDIPELLENAGLILDSMHGDFDESPFDDTSEFMVVRAKHA